MKLETRRTLMFYVGIANVLLGSYSVFFDKRYYSLLSIVLGVMLIVQYLQLPKPKA